MEFRKVLALRGPNVWANSPILEAWVDLGSFQGIPVRAIPGFIDRLLAWVPTLHEHECNTGHSGGLTDQLHGDTSLAHVLEHVTLEFQSLVWKPVSYGRSRETSEPGVFRVAVKYHDEQLARACLDAARALCLAAIHNEPYDCEAELNKLRRLAYRVCLGPSTNAIVSAAIARGIPFRRLNSESLVQLGHGHKQRRIRTAETDRTSTIAEAVAQDKDLTRLLLRAVGVPVPMGRPVESAEDAWEAARELAAPVVVKPRFGNQGRGVATNLSTREQVVAAFAAAKEEGDSVVVERYHSGEDYRVLVVDGQVIAASKRQPAHVIGDGRSTIAELVDEVNKDPRRGEDHATALSKIVLNSIALAVLDEQGYTPESVPPPGQRVLIRRNANLSTGGTAEDVTDLVHPEVATRSIDAARVIGLDIAGIDVIADDISRPLEEQDGAVVEVNAGPGLRMHIEPSSGKSRPVGEAIIGSLFPEGENGRIPIAAVTGVNGKTTVTRLLAHMASQSGQVVGMTCSDGIYIAGRRIEAGDCSGPQSARAVLMNPKVETAVLETARGGILREGLGFDRCDVAVVTNLGEGDHLGLADIHTVEALAQVKRSIVDVVAPDGVAVLNADDALVAAMAPHCKGSVIYWAWSETNPTLRVHREQGGRAVFVRDGMVILATGAEETPLLGLTRVPLTRLGRLAFQVENVLSASAAAWAFKLPLDAIRAGLSTFDSTPEQTPGRFNVLEANGATVIVDYAHNVSAVAALVDAVKPFPASRRRIVFSAAGDRRDEDIIRQMEMIGDVFDSVVLHETSDRRGKPEGEIFALLRRGLVTGARVSETLEAADESDAVRIVLDDLRDGDLVVIQPDVIDRVLRQVQKSLADVPVKMALEPVPFGVEVAYALPVD